jgi:hypothetical protein
MQSQPRAMTDQEAVNYMSHYSAKLAVLQRLHKLATTLKVYHGGTPQSCSKILQRCLQDDTDCPFFRTIIPKTHIF